MMVAGKLELAMDSTTRKKPHALTRLYPVI